MKHTPEYRIKKIMNFYYDRGQNRESVNEVYRNLLKKKFQKELIKEIMKLDEKDKLYNN
jgi:hypothetical protein